MEQIVINEPFFLLSSDLLPTLKLSWSFVHDLKKMCLVIQALPNIVNRTDFYFKIRAD